MLGALRVARPSGTFLERKKMTPAAEAAKKAFHETLRAKGRRLDQACLEEAWERAVEAVNKCVNTVPNNSKGI
jgi:hypothetical protein